MAGVKLLLERSNKDKACVEFICKPLDFGNDGNACGTYTSQFVWEENVIYSTSSNPFNSSIKYWNRFIDEILVLWNG